MCLASARSSVVANPRSWPHSCSALINGGNFLTERHMLRRNSAICRKGTGSDQVVENTFAFIKTRREREGGGMKKKERKKGKVNGTFVSRATYRTRPSDAMRAVHV